MGKIKHNLRILNALTPIVNYKVMDPPWNHRGPTVKKPWNKYRTTIAVEQPSNDRQFLQAKQSKNRNDMDQSRV